jgi:UDP-N-acetylmuramoyl-L-alanyl-D-glutamate--2,6-diaminopimelate ligase
VIDAMTHIHSSLPLGELLSRVSSAGHSDVLSFGLDSATAGLVIPRVTSDSREVTAGSLFVAVSGGTQDGHAYVQQAAQLGAAAALVERTVEDAGIPLILVNSTRGALSEVAAALAGDPGRQLDISAVTGTNGKTTTAWLIAQALGIGGQKCGYVGTIGAGIPGSLQPATHTTPGAVELQNYLADLLREGCSAVALEASSHALDQQRIAGFPLKASVFTNLTRDHLDYHGDQETYFRAKAQLFENLDPATLCVLNEDDPAGRRIAASCSNPVLTYGTEPTSDIQFTIRSDMATGLRLLLDGLDARFRLSGFFNAYNLAAAYSALAANGLSAAERIDALTEAAPAPGRFETLQIGRDRVAIIDYAHTPDALRNVLEAARRIVPAGANLWCLFGCGGDRDTGKRPLMGAIAEEFADRVVVTSDNPRHEDPQGILDDIREGVRQPERQKWMVDRKEAIHMCVQSAGLGDVIVVAGKGPEPYQIVGDERCPFQDESEVKAAAGI